MNKAKNDMFPGCKTLNILRGRCEYECKYCYMKFGKLKELSEYKEPYHIAEKALRERIPKSAQIIFTGSTTDIFAPKAGDLTYAVLDRTNDSDVPPGVTWLFQTKNPKCYDETLFHLPKNAILGTTIETDLYPEYRKISKAPLPENRILSLRSFAMSIRRRQKFSITAETYETPAGELPVFQPTEREFPQKIMVNIEPAIQFDVDNFLKQLIWLNPEYLSIGAETCGVFKRLRIPQPNYYDVYDLLHELAHSGSKTQIYVKSNIYRLANKNDRGDFMRMLRELISHHGVIVQGDPTCQQQEFFLTPEKVVDEQLSLL
ncbi:MAG: hypothetical protein ACW99G_01540 [Candidatus Thorarchaeota archaeon]|jgi:hypothetical protein